MVNPELFGKTGYLGTCTCGHATEIIAGFNKEKKVPIYSVSCFKCGVTYIPAARIAEAIDNYMTNKKVRESSVVI
jgi:hypothetical protein